MKKKFLLLLLSLLLAMSLQIPTYAASPAEARLNAIPLLPPQTTRSAALNEMLGGILSQITTPEMTNYQKVKACYDWLIACTEYGSPDLNGIGGSFATIDDLLTYGTLVSHRGVCDNYSAAFVAMTRVLGFDSYVVGGQTHKSSGGYTPHAWAIIWDGKEAYVFDPQIEDKIAKGGKVSYLRFCKTYAEVQDKYIVEEPINGSLSSSSDPDEWYGAPISAGQIQVFAYHD